MSHEHDRSPESAQGPSAAQASAAQGPAIAPAHEMASEHRPGLLPEKYFRWRSGEITRLEAFCDVVFGFALTLLVVSLEVPRNYAELMEAMRGFVPFAACFMQLILIWRTHYRFSRRYGLEDSYTVLLNVVLLFVVLFYVYPLKFVFRLVFDELAGSAAGGLGWHEASVLMRIYAVGFVAVFTLFALMYAHAYKLRHELRLNPVETLETRLAVREYLLTALVGALSFTLAFKNPEWAGWSYFLLAPLLTFHGTFYGRRVRQLAEKLGRA